MADAHATAAPTEFSLAIPLQFAAADGPTSEPRPRKLRGVAYSGEVITGHWYWDAVVFDLASTSAPAKLPILVEHDRAQRAGFASLAISASQIDIADGTLLDNGVGAQVAAEADAGFPWQLSVNIVPERIDQLNAGETQQVNGRTVTGPLVIFRNALIREVSLTPTGADHRTSAAVFSARASTPTHEESPMTDPTPKAGAAAVDRDAIREEVRAEFAAQIDDLSRQLDALKAEKAEAARAQRMSAVKSLFADLGREFTDVAAAPYLGMDETAFAAIAADLRASKPKLPGLFSHQAITGTGGDSLADPHKFAAAIHARQAKAREEGRDISLIEAARLVREDAA